MTTPSRVRAKSLVASASAALIIAAALPASPAFAEEGDPGLPTTAVITGVVTDPAGDPAADVCIGAAVLDGDAWVPVEATSEVRTDSSGAYELFGLADGMYIVSADECEAPSEVLRTWSPSLDAPPAIVEGTAAEGIIVSEGVADSRGDISLLPAEIVALTAPTVTGELSVGSTLDAHPGTWNVTGLDFGYQWFRDEVPIAGASGQSYDVTFDDIGAAIRVEVRAARSSWGEGTARSDATESVPRLPMVPVAPTVSGVAQVGSTLVAATENWSPALTPTFTWYRDGVAIEGAIGTSYTLTAEDRGATIAVRATGELAGYTSTSIDSTPTAAVVAGLLATSAPKITGTAKVGSQLTATSGWTPSGITYAYQWKRNGTAITGATKSTYTPVAADLGGKLTVSVSGSLAGYTTVSLNSAATAAVAIGTFSAPTATVSGTVAVGRTVTATPGTWKPGATFTYQWKRNGVTIPGATKSTYAVPTADLKAALSVAITGKAAGYTTLTRTSAAATVAYGTLTAPTPTVSGTKAVAKTLTAVPGTWTSGTTLSYQWKRNGAAISGATKSTYVLTTTDHAKTITVTVTGRKTAYTTASKTSTAGAAIAAGTFSAPTPTISGTRAVGKTLTAVPGTWKPTAAFSYQWKRAGVAIGGATKSTYVLTAADLGKSLTVTVTGRKGAYTTASKTSGGTAAIAAGTMSLSAKVTGTAKYGYTLSAVASAASGATLSYQWYRNGSVISGATGRTYKLGYSDVWKSVAVTITARKAGYQTVAARSAGTASVQAPNVAPPVNGTWDCPAWAPIKGNQGSPEWIYHMPGQRFYNATNPEQCFSSESAAVAAHYRKAKV
ncbi:hypothetical protein [Agromyces sp. NPDC058110]|uniref:sunset domain-containing protein n=1 Tax=Agromyces sp. NPDC058110 TaxID=3346345 RepID=UPI0036DF120A